MLPKRMATPASVFSLRRGTHCRPTPYLVVRLRLWLEASQHLHLHCGVSADARICRETYDPLTELPGGTNVTVNSSGVQLSKLLYKPCGETRLSTGTTPTTWRFTGQREDCQSAHWTLI